AGKISGAGAIQAKGGLQTQLSGGGGALAIQYTDPTTVLPSISAAGGSGSGGAGSIWIKGPQSIYGDLILDNGGSISQPTDLPALGHGTALAATTGATLVTDRSTDIPAYFKGHWVEIISASGTVKGIWRIG